MDRAKYNAGRLRERMRLERRVRTADSAGGYVTEWTTVASGVPVSLEPTSARERMYAESLQQERTHRIVMRYRSDITTDHRFVLEPAGSRVFAVHGVVDVEERHRWLEITASEGTAP